MLMYEAVHFHTNRLSPKQQQRRAKSNQKNETSKTRSTFNMERLLSQNAGLNRTGSFVVGQKLRESKWFTHEEIKILCAVVETGFVVEVKNENDTSLFGIILWTPGYEKSKNPDHVKICTLKKHKNNYRVATIPLFEFWTPDTRIRINNQMDKANQPHKEEIIRDQVAYAECNKSKWHNSEHFTYWCRYGPPHINYRFKHASDNQKWPSFGLNGFAVLKNRFRRMTTSK